MKTKRFLRRIENFVCAKCGCRVQGDGYTDHCPNCLQGRHVDINPGDRAAECRGMMEPVNVFKKGDRYVIEYVCEKCGNKFRVKAAEEDDFNTLIKIIEN